VASDLSTGGCRLSRIVDDFSFVQDLYFGRNRTYRVATAYKAKANKVRPVDLGDSDGSKPRGCLDWFEKSKAGDVPCYEPKQFSDWITPKFSSIKKGSWLTEECIEDLVVGDSLWLKEKELLVELLYNQEAALAFDFSEIRKVNLDVVLP
jgi:hypothetical protein